MTQKLEIPAILKAAERLLFELESAVAMFPRKHRYSLGADIRTDAVRAVLLTQLAFRAATERQRQAKAVAELSDAIDLLKIRLKLARRLQCYSAGRFEAIVKLIVSFGRQCGGWQRQINQHLSGQNPASRRSLERAQTLSTRAASAEANR